MNGGNLALALLFSKRAYRGDAETSNLLPRRGKVVFDDPITLPEFIRVVTIPAFGASMQRGKDNAQKFTIA